jgi:hypothetical protein
MRKLIILFIIIISFSACTKRDKRKVVDDPKSVSEIKKEDNTVDIAHLPLHIDSTNFLIHPIGNYKIEKSRSKYYSEDGVGYSSLDNYSSNNYNGYKIVGDLSNVKFQHINSKKLNPITNQVIKIQSMSFLYRIFNDHKIEIYVYDVIDKDTNKDGKLTYEDLKSIYISKHDGSDFKRISPQQQEVSQWKEMTTNKRLYFKSIEDADNNGEFDKKDKTHYFYLDLSIPNSKVVEYYPI